MQRWAVGSLLVCLLGGTPPAWGFDFVPTDQEFNSWPDWCKGTYVTSNIGSRSRFAPQITPRVRSQALRGFWHHCAGLIWLDRARGQRDPDRARFEYRQAIAETMYNYAQWPSDHPRMGEMGTTLGLAHRGLGDLVSAKQYLTRAIQNQPQYAPAYTAMSLVYRDEENLDAARDILLRGNEVVQGKSSEIHYFLGLLYLDIGNIPEAEKHSQQAYKLGYPLPGLKNKLERAKRGGQTDKADAPPSFP